jgi:hypothetical protein
MGWAGTPPEPNRGAFAKLARPPRITKTLDLEGKLSRCCRTVKAGKLRIIAYIFVAAGAMVIINTLPKPKQAASSSVHAKCYSSQTGSFMRFIYRCP